MLFESGQNRANFQVFLWIAPLFVSALLSMSPTADDAPDCPNGDIEESLKRVCDSTIFNNTTKLH